MSDQYLAVVDSLSTIDRKMGEYHQRAKEEVRELSERVNLLEQRGPTLDAGRGAGMPSRKSIGAILVAALEPNREMLAKAGRVRFEAPLEVKAAGDPITNITVGTITQLPGLAVPGPFAFGLQSVLPPVGSISTTQIQYSRYSAIEGAAAVQAAEGDAKAAVRPTHTKVTQDAITIAGHTVVSEQAASDQAGLRAAINSTLARSMALALDDALVDGAVSPAFSGFEALATAYTSLVYDNIVDAASEGVSDMQQAGFMPTICVMSPADWLAVVTAKASGSGEYLSGSYLGTLPENMRGLRVGISSNVAAGKVLLIDPSFCEWHTLQAITFEIDRINDQFVKNLLTVRAEMRIVPVFRAVGAARLITPSA